MIRSSFALLIAVLLAGCDASPPGAASSSGAPAPEVAATESGDPTTQAIQGAAERSLQGRHPGATLVIADQALSTTATEPTMCGRYVAVKRTWQGRRYFIASSTGVEVVEKTSTQWKDTCDGAKPVPGALTGPAVDAAVTAAVASAES